VKQEELDRIYTDKSSLKLHPQRQRVRNIAYTAVFGSLWGFSEFFLGSILHAVQIPLRSHVLQGIGVIIAFTGALFIKRDFSIIRIALIAAFFKMFSFGGGNTLPVIMAILVQALLADMFLLILRKNIVGYIVAAGIGFMWIPINMPLYNLMLFGDEIIEPFLKNGRRTLEHIGLQVDPDSILQIVIGVFAFNFLFGAAIGLLAFILGKQIKRTLGID
jgi:hypothetical protein